jgi:hypothetical protein
LFGHLSFLQTDRPPLEAYCLAPFGLRKYITYPQNLGGLGHAHVGLDLPSWGECGETHATASAGVGELVGMLYINV